jgi:hypothetical protein
MLVEDKHSSLLAPIIRYEEDEVLRIRFQPDEEDHLLLKIWLEPASLKRAPNTLAYFTIPNHQLFIKKLWSNRPNSKTVRERAKKKVLSRTIF